MNRILPAFGALLFGTAQAVADPPLTFYPTGGPAPFSAAVQVGDILYLSGQIGVDAGGRLVDGFEGQVRQAMANIVSVLAARGRSLDDVFKCTVFLADMSNWNAFNEVYVGYFKPGRLPARSALGATGLAAGAALELECIAYAPAQPRPPN